MAKKINIEKLFNKIANNSDKPDIAALKYLKKTYGTIPSLQFILETMFEEKHIEGCCKFIMECLINSNNIEDKKITSLKFIFNAIDSGYSERMIIRLIEIAIENKLDINFWEISPKEVKDIMFFLVGSNNYTDNITSIYKLLLENGYKHGKTRKSDNKNIIEFIEFMKEKYNKIIPDKEEFITEYNKACKDNNYLIKKDLDYLTKDKKIGKIYNDEKDKFLETFGEFIKNEEYAKKYPLDKKYYADMYCSINNNKFTLVEGKDEGVNLITEFGLLLLSNSNFDNIKKKRILKTSYNRMLNNCTSIGSLCENTILLMRICAEYNIILYIEDFYEIYKSIKPWGYNYLKR